MMARNALRKQLFDHGLIYNSASVAPAGTGSVSRRPSLFFVFFSPFFFSENELLQRVVKWRGARKINFRAVNCETLLKWRTLLILGGNLFALFLFWGRAFNVPALCVRRWVEHGGARQRDAPARSPLVGTVRQHGRRAEVVHVEQLVPVTAGNVVVRQNGGAGRRPEVPVQNVPSGRTSSSSLHTPSSLSWFLSNQLTSYQKPHHLSVSLLQSIAFYQFPSVLCSSPASRAFPLL